MVTVAELTEILIATSELPSCTKNVSLFSIISSFVMTTGLHWKDVLPLNVRTAGVSMKSIPATEISKCRHRKYSDHNWFPLQRCMKGVRISC